MAISTMEYSKWFNKRFYVRDNSPSVAHSVSNGDVNRKSPIALENERWKRLIWMSFEIN